MRSDGKPPIKTKMDGKGTAPRDGRARAHATLASPFPVWPKHVPHNWSFYPKFYLSKELTILENLLLLLFTKEELCMFTVHSYWLYYSIFIHEWSFIIVLSFMFMVPYYSIFIHVYSLLWSDSRYWLVSFLQNHPLPFFGSLSCFVS